MIIDGSIHKSGFPIGFVPVLIKPIKDKHILTPFELKMKALFKKMLAKKNKGKKKKTKKKGGKKSKYNIKMARKFRRTRRKRGSGGPTNKDGKAETTEEYNRRRMSECAEAKAEVKACIPFMHNQGYPSYGGGGRRRRTRRRKKRSRRKKKRTRRRRRKKR